MPELDPAMAAILAEVKRQALPDYETMTPAEARAEASRRNAFWNQQPVPLARVEDVTVPAAAGRDGIKVRLYAAEAGTPSPAPCVLYLHGGGWVFCSPDTHDNVCRRLARANAAVWRRRHRPSSWSARSARSSPSSSSLVPSRTCSSGQFGPVFVVPSKAKPFSSRSKRWGSLQWASSRLPAFSSAW